MLVPEILKPPAGSRTGICIIVENLPVPLDRRVWREARALHEGGYLVSVISPKGKKSFRASYEVIDGIHIYRHRIWESSGIFGYLLEYTTALIAEFFLSLKVFARTRFRILQGCSPPDTIFLIALFFRLFGVRYVFDHHDLSPELFSAKFGARHMLLGKLLMLAERCSFRTAHVSLATNESFRDIAITRGGRNPANVFVVRNCPDLAELGRDHFPEPKPKSPCTVVYVGFMGTQDGLSLLLESIEHIVRRRCRQDVRFLLVGGGTELPRLQEWSARKKLDDYVQFTGQVPYESVIEYLSSADIGVAPDPKNQLNDKSTMIKILEYMAFGLPVVLFDLKEGRRMAGAAALYTKPNDCTDFAENIIELVDNCALRRSLGHNGRARIEQRLNWAIEKEAFLRAYRTALQTEPEWLSSFRHAALSGPNSRVDSSFSRSWIFNDELLKDKH